MIRKQLVILFLFIILQHKFYAQTNISGIVNSYTAVNSYDSCYNNCLNVANSAGFSVGDYVLIIQMKGMRINETNSAAFGTFINYDSTGFYEKSRISSISGNQICLVNDLAISYKLSGKVQMVKIARYSTGANIVGTIIAPPWNGSTGGIVAIEVQGTLTMNADVDVSGLGFKGGKSGGAISNACSALTSISDYATDSISWEFKSFKGEGVADYIPNKWSCRGPQANGGGGGNDHNSGGGGGANLTTGGIGGRNNEPGFFNCKGYQPGLGGKGLSPLYKDRLFLGGGGGSGHQNNAVNFAGGNGGGIVYIRATTLVGNNRWIKANGDSSKMSGQDGGSGGGAGGTIKLDVITFTGNLNIAANGGRGASTNNAASNRCFGPGGGGAGGDIHLKQASIPSGIFIQNLGGAPGIVFNSSNSCNGSSNSATAGSLGITTFYNNIIPVSKSGASNCLFRRSNYSTQIEKTNKDEVQMQISSNQFYLGCEVLFEKSIDGENFDVINRIKIQNEELKDVQTLDKNLLIGNNFYRITIRSKSQETLYSSDIYYIYNGLNWSNEDIIVYPNPIKLNQDFQLFFPSTEETLRIRIIDIQGKLIANKFLSSNESMTGNTSIHIENSTENNLLLIQIIGEKGNIFIKKVFVQ